MIGGSTLVTQLEKIRHSPRSRTGSALEKLRQVASASLRAYANGPDTLRAQQQIICDYINSIPLAATRDEGEVIGLADGLRDWYGANPDTVNRLFLSDERMMSEEQMAARARAYREALSLMLALHAPTRALVREPEALNARVDRYLRALAANGTISTRLGDLALRTQLQLRPAGPGPPPQSFVANKGPDANSHGIVAGTRSE